MHSDKKPEAMVRMSQFYIFVLYFILIYVNVAEVVLN